MAAPTTTHSVTVRKLSSTIASLWAKIKSTFQTLGNLVTAWGSTPSDTKYPSEKLVKTSLDAISTNARTIPQDISKGVNLVVNGSGVMGNNYNWDACSFNANTDLPEGVAGCFHWSGGDFFQKEKIAVNTSKSYIVESWYRVKTANTSTVRLTVACYDVDAKSISAIYSTYGVGTLTQLTEDLKPGDTVVHLADLSNSNWKSATNYHHGFIFWNYKNSYGYQYPPETYSRNVYPSSGSVYLWTNVSQVDQTNNTITLDSAWSGPTIPAGTYVSRRNSGSTYYYAKTSATSGALTTWTKLSGLVKGFVTPGGTDGGCFRPGTAFIRIGWVNANTSGNEWFEFAGCELREIPEQISGTLPVANGGTGKTTAKAAQNALLGGMNSVSTDAPSTASLVFKYSSPNDSDGAVFTRPLSNIWSWIKGQISSVLGLSESNGVKTFTGDSATASAAKSGSALETAINGKQDDLGISSSGDTTKFLNEKGLWATPDGTSAKVKSYYVSDSLKGVKFATTTITTNDATAYGVFQFTRLQIGTGIKTLSGSANRPIVGIVQIFHRTNGSGETVAANVMARITILQSDFTGQIRVYYQINGSSVDWYIATTTAQTYVRWSTLKLFSSGTVNDIDLSGVDDVSTLTENNASYKTPLVAAASTGTGSETNPVYVDGTGRLQACDFDEAYKSITQLGQSGTGYDTTTTVINSTHILQATANSYVINIKRLKVSQVYKFMFLEGSNSGQVYLCNGNGSNFTYASGPNGGTTKKLSLNGGAHGSSYTSYVIRDGDTSVYHIWGY